MPTDVQLAKITRGLSFFTSLSQICYLAVAFIMLRMFFLLWTDVPHDATGMAWTVLMSVAMGLLLSLPYLFIALGLRHIRNLFAAVRDAITELQTTV